MFSAGLVYSVISLVLTGVMGLSHLTSHIGGSGISGHHAGHAIDHHAGHVIDHHSDAMDHGNTHSPSQFSWLLVLINPIVMVSFFTIFGGIGIIGTAYLKWIPFLIFPVALASGIIVAYVLYKFVAVPLYKAENTSNVYREELIGKAAEVDSGILENGFGKIKYTVNFIRFTAPARHIEGKSVKQGVKVVICKIENNIF